MTRKKKDSDEIKAFRDRLRVIVTGPDAFGKQGTQAQFAKKVGAGVASVSDWLTEGKPRPRFEQICAIARATGVSLDWLLIGKGTRDGVQQQGSLENALAAKVAQAVQDRLGVHGDDGAPVLEADGAALVNLCVKEALRQIEAFKAEWIDVVGQRQRTFETIDSLGSFQEHLPALVPSMAPRTRSILQRALGEQVSSLVASLRDPSMTLPVVWFRKAESDEDSVVSASQAFLYPDGSPIEALLSRVSAIPPILQALVRELEHAPVHRKSVRKSARPASRGKPAAKGGRSRRLG
ncbi:MAG: helix-turn-helix domain-containing protein [Gemmatimonadetes bacterium]|nr:helix-turn-helix domain-containing protein [Gemmatimonadota bacterium]